MAFALSFHGQNGFTVALKALIGACTYRPLMRADYAGA
jgi:hypothetical protein